MLTAVTRPRAFRTHPRRSGKVVPFKRRIRGWSRTDLALFAALPLAAFTAVFVWQGPPAVEAAALRSAPPLVPQSSRWRSAAELDGRQPDVQRAAVSGGASGGTGASAHFTLCAGGARVTCVVDGDTFWLGGDKIRIADINTPETNQAGCPAERERGVAAKLRLLDLLNAGPFALERGNRDRDGYGRLLREVVRDGQSLGQQLIAEGLAEPWRGKRSDWCALLAAR